MPLAELPRLRQVPVLGTLQRIGTFGSIGAWIQGQRLDPDLIAVVDSWRGMAKTMN